MNLLMIFLVSISMLSILSVTLTVLMYLRLRHHKKNGRKITSAAVEGEFFKRYVPEHLKNDLRLALKSRQGKSLFSGHLITLAGACALILLFLHFNQDRLYHKIDLSHEELKAFERHAGNEFSWKFADRSTVPSFAELAEDFRKFEVILLYSTESDFRNTAESESYASHVTDARESWQRMLREKQVRYRSCHWPAAENCRKAAGKPVLWLVSLSLWNLDFIQKRLAEGDNFLLQGPPLQLFSGKKGRLEWNGLTFVRKSGISPTAAYLSLVGDEVLTLGKKAGTVMEVPAISNQYYTYSHRPQAVTMGSGLEVGGPVYTRLFAHATGRGKFVWMDHFASTEDTTKRAIADTDTVNALMFRYLLNRQYSALGTWPRAAKMAALIEQDTEDRYENTERVLGLFQTYDIPVTFFVLSDEAQKHRGLTEKMAAYQKAELACHGDSHDRFTNGNEAAQLIRLGRCRKVVEAITGRKITGFRPPEERYNDETVNAVAALKLNYYFASNSAMEGVPTLLQDSKSGQKLVSLPRISQDDYALWYVQNLNEQASFKVIKHEIDWSSMLGALYTFSFHTQFIGDDGNLRALERLLSYLTKMDAWLGTGEQIAEWWKFRHALAENQETRTEDFARFEPHLLFVDSNGILLKKPFAQTSPAGNPDEASNEVTLNTRKVAK